MAYNSATGHSPRPDFAGDIEVGSLLSKRLEPGHHRIVSAPEDLLSGIYCARLNAGGFQARRKLILIK